MTVTTLLCNRRILLGVTGSIAAYKAATLVRELQHLGADVRVVMTRSAEKFVGAATFQGLSGHPVDIHLFDNPAAAPTSRPAADTTTDPVSCPDEDGMKHIHLSRWADFFLIAPASASTLARMAHGLADELVAAIYLAGNTPVAVAPAMNRLMWQHPATRANLELLKKRGVSVWGPADGEQACGEEGEGRLLEPDEIVAHLAEKFASKKLAGHRVVVTAGPTCESIDAVRCLSNHSSGKMGFALARAAAGNGADVTLISGPVSLVTPPAVRRVDVVNAEQMRKETLRHTAGADIFISCAAVADYRPLRPFSTKIKKSREALNLHLVRTRDILAEVSASSPRPFLVGFAAETDHLETNARSKLMQKKLDIVVACRVGPNAKYSFGDDVAQVHVYWHGGSKTLPPSPKTDLSEHLLDLFIHRYGQKHRVERREHTG